MCVYIVFVYVCMCVCMLLCICVYRVYVCICMCMVYVMCVFKSPRNRGGVIFSLQFVCVSVCVPDSACEQNSSRTDETIWTLLKLVTLGQRSRSQ